MALKADAGNDVIALYDENNDAAYVLYIGAAVSSVVDTENVVFVTKQSTESSKNGYETAIYFMDGNTAETVTTKSNYDKGFYTYSIDEDNVYELAPVKLYNETVSEDTTGGAVFSFVFVRKPADLHDLQEDTSLQRKLKKMYLEGDCIHTYTGAIFVEE